MTRGSGESLPEETEMFFSRVPISRKVDFRKVGGLLTTPHLVIPPGTSCGHCGGPVQQIEFGNEPDVALRSAESVK